MKYQEWIMTNGWNNQSKARNNCATATLAMTDTFPELTRVRGYYTCPIAGTTPHWWTVDQNGKIIDPTKSQFPSMGEGDYSPLDETQEHPTGKCLNCGEWTFNYSNFCNTECANDAISYLIH